MTKKTLYDDELQQILLSLGNVEEKLELWLTANKIKYKRTDTMKYKILNGCEKNIMFYPEANKINIQVDGVNYIQVAPSHVLLSVINGDIPYRRKNGS